MKPITRFGILLAVLFLCYNQSEAQQNNTAENNDSLLNTYLIERDIPGAGNLPAADLKGISQKSCSVIKELGPQIQWLHSYVTDNKIFCVYKAENQELLREHAEKGGFPITSITEVSTTISPATAEN